MFGQQSDLGQVDVAVQLDHGQKALQFGIAMSAKKQPAKALSEYTEFNAPAPLAAHFLCFWTQTITGTQGAYEHRVLPDGCLDIVLINDEPAVVVGPWTVPFVARLAAGTIVTGARLHPGRASWLLGMPASELLNQAIPMAALKGGMQKMRLEKVTEQRDAEARRSALAQTLLAAVESPAPWDEAVLAAIQWLSRHPHGRIEQLSHAMGISERQLHRRFSAAVGYSPKMFHSVLRFQRLLKTGREAGAEQGLANLAASAGYADQAHMTREVRRFASLRPTMLLRSAECTLTMSDLFKT
jgi:AraC-like DNA-binding protein